MYNLSLPLRVILLLNIDLPTAHLFHGAPTHRIIAIVRPNNRKRKRECQRVRKRDVRKEKCMIDATKEKRKKERDKERKKIHFWGDDTGSMYIW